VRHLLFVPELKGAGEQRSHSPARLRDLGLVGHSGAKPQHDESSGDPGSNPSECPHFIRRHIIIGATPRRFVFCCGLVTSKSCTKIHNDGDKIRAHNPLYNNMAGDIQGQRHDRSALVLYGSETGNSQDVAEDLGRMTERLHFRTRVCEMDQVEIVGAPSSRCPCCRIFSACSFFISRIYSWNTPLLFSQFQPRAKANSPVMQGSSGKASSENACLLIAWVTWPSPPSVLGIVPTRSK
jgi:hypothetical protein